jgi:glutamate synthase (NADPH/NADH) large chain/glutamate synthase (ferredoxin)
MTGGIAYVLDEEGCLRGLTNHEHIDLDELGDDKERCRALLAIHVQETASQKGHRLLADWDNVRHKIVRVLPKLPPFLRDASPAPRKAVSA